MHDRLSVANDLNLDMTHALPITLDIERIHSEGRLRFGLAALPGGSEFAAVAHDAHATPAAAGHRLDYDRLAGAEPVEKGLGVLQGRSLISTLQHGNATFAREFARRGLVAEQFEGFGRRADEGQPGRSESAREICIFRQEAVARMNRVAGCIARRFDDRVDGEIGRSALARQLTRLVACEHMARAGIVGGKDRDRDDIELRGRPRDAQGYLAAIGYEYLAKRHIKPSAFFRELRTKTMDGSTFCQYLYLFRGGKA